LPKIRAKQEIKSAFAELRIATFSFTSVSQSVNQSVSQHGTTRLPLDGVPRNLILEYFSKICGENSSFVNISQE